MIVYAHRQFGSVLVAAMSVGAVICLLAALPAREFALIPLLTALVLLCVAVLFSSLSIEVTDEELRWHFGQGLIHKRVPLAEIAEVQVTRSRWWDGFGIHLTARGWLYNVSGFGAVAIRLHSGKRFVLGTDEPETLARCLSQQLIHA